ncbi:kinase-like domain-containing protein [Suillus occidentalis]|nr:kinase-like domain-containing protein [Suillus occidentalis]
MCGNATVFQNVLYDIAILSINKGGAELDLSTITTVAMPRTHGFTDESIEGQQIERQYIPSHNYMLGQLREPTVKYFGIICRMVVGSCAAAQLMLTQARCLLDSRQFSQTDVPDLAAESAYLMYFGSAERRHTMPWLLNLLGSSLHDIFLAHHQKFNLNTVVNLGDQLVSQSVLARLEYIHSHNYIHGDIKPQNIVMGLDDSRHTAFIIDFGVEPGRHDDIESLAYMLIYFLHGSLPWLSNDHDKLSNTAILECKVNTTVEALCHGIPVEFDPDHDYLRSLLHGLRATLPACLLDFSKPDNPTPAPPNEHRVTEVTPSCLPEGYTSSPGQLMSHVPFASLSLHIQANPACNQSVVIGMSSEDEAPQHSVPSQIYRVLIYIRRDLVIGFPIVYYGATNMPPRQHAPKAAAASIAAPIPTPIIAAPIAAATAPILATASITPIAIAAFTNPQSRLAAPSQISRWC